MKENDLEGVIFRKDDKEGLMCFHVNDTLLLEKERFIDTFMVSDPSFDLYKRLSSYVEEQNEKEENTVTDFSLTEKDLIKELMRGMANAFDSRDLIDLSFDELQEIGAEDALDRIFYKEKIKLNVFSCFFWNTVFGLQNIFDLFMRELCSFVYSFFNDLFFNKISKIRLSDDFEKMVSEKIRKSESIDDLFDLCADPAIKSGIIRNLDFMGS